MKPSFLYRIILSIAFLLNVASGARAKLMVGDKAPKLQTGKWIQGEPVSGFDTNHVYIVEFWATWCGPCVGSIPHLNELSEKFKDKGVIVIGQDVWDSDDAVAPFVKKMGDKMTYRVALDDKSQDKEGFMSSNWWPRKINHHGIPNAFIINRDGVIAWIGHPLTLDKHEEILTDIVSGHYDLAKAKVDYQKQFDTESQLQQLRETLDASINQRKWDDAQLSLSKLYALMPSLTNGFYSYQLMILIGQRKYDAAYQFADLLGQIHSTNQYWLNSLAWAICRSENPDTRCLQLGEKMASRGVQMENGKDEAALDSLARTQFMLGKKQEAIATEEKAVGVTSNPREKSFLEKTLASYQEGKLPDAE